MEKVAEWCLVLVKSCNHRCVSRSGYFNRFSFFRPGAWQKIWHRKSMAFYKYAVVESKGKYCFYLYLSLWSTDWNSYNSFAINILRYFVILSIIILSWSDKNDENQKSNKIYKVAVIPTISQNSKRIYSSLIQTSNKNQHAETKNARREGCQGILWFFRAYALGEFRGFQLTQSPREFQWIGVPMFVRFHPLRLVLPSVYHPSTRTKAPAGFPLV